MPIQRTCDFPPFSSYLTDCALIPYNSTPSKELLALASHSCKWLEIPSFQRGIAWRVGDVMEDLLNSQSPIMGNVLLGQFQRESMTLGCLPTEVSQYCVIIDGLQRFSIGTALLALLHPKVLHHSPEFTNEASHFTTLKLRCGNMAPVFQHNDHELLNHPRRAISHAYAELKEGLDNYLDNEFKSGNGSELAEKITEVFLNKQISIDVYHNFRSRLDMMSAFLGINTIRVDLGPIDLFRSFIVEKATYSGWEQGVIEAVENRITEIFTNNGKPKTQLLPFIFICLGQIEDSNKVPNIFPSWTEYLDAKEVSSFLTFVEDFMASDDNGFIHEIQEVGALPLAGLLLYFYRLALTGELKPNYVAKKSPYNDVLCGYLRACLRAYLEGKMGKSRSIIEKLIADVDLKECAEKLSQVYSGISLATKYEEGRLKVLVQRADITKSKRIFNAMLLPETSEGHTSYSPNIYGIKSIEYHIDHLVPKSTLDNHCAGYLEGDTIVNFAPLPSALNKNAKATPCSLKLTHSGDYGNYISSDNFPHYYTKWLLDTQGEYGSDLDFQEYLESNSDVSIRDERLGFISAELAKRV